MSKGWLTAVAAAALALPAVALPLPAAASGQLSTSAARSVPAAVLMPAVRSALGSTPYVPCPHAGPHPPPAHTAWPSRPDAKSRVVGGAALATRGLAAAPKTAAPPALSARSWLVADLDTGAVLGACGAHEYGIPASVQKLLLAATMLPKLDPTRVIEVTRGDLDFERGSSAVGLLAGGHYPVETLWLGLFLNSGNDAARVLARLGGGAAGLPGGVAAMNAEARRLGAYQTHAVTPSGLDGPGQFTSAYDLALIARACFAREDFRRYVATRQTHIPAQPPMDPHGFGIQNDNQLLYHYRGALGGKTGYTDLARHSYVGAAQRNGRRLLVTLLGAESSPLPGWRQGAALLDWGFDLPQGVSVGHLVTPDEVRLAATPPVASGAVQARVPATKASSESVSSVAAIVAVAVTVVVVLLTFLLAWRRRRARG